MNELTQQDVQDLMREGYSQEEILKTWNEIKVEDKYSPTQRQTQNFPSQKASIFTPQIQDNLIKWQLELDNILERTEHILRGDILIFEQGNLLWKENPTPEVNVLNENGVREVMKVLSMYLNRNTILSDYDPKQINEKVFDFGKELNDLFFMKYEEIFNYPTYEQCRDIFLKRIQGKEKQVADIYKDFFGITLDKTDIKTLAEVGTNYDKVLEELEKIKRELTLSKRKNYPMLHRQLIDIIHSSYLRALHGGERRSLREARQITQTEQLSQGGVTVNAGMGGGGATRGMLNPLRYLSSKYK